MQNWATRALLAALCVMALPVMATPPRTMDIRDRLFVRNAETLFLIRDIRDNHGLHGVTQTDTLLVFRNLAGGDDRGFQGVARVVDLGPDAEQRAEVLPLSSRINPYDLFADFDAWPLNAPRYGDPSSVLLSGEGLVLHEILGKLRHARRVHDGCSGGFGASSAPAGGFVSLTEQSCR